jgi:molybdopterin-guanine dinucleotide biosynthesis protein B
MLHPTDPNIVAIACDAPVNTTLPVLDLNQPDTIVDFIVEYLER